MNYALGPAAAAAIAEVARQQATAGFADAIAFAVAREQADAAEQRLELRALLDDMRAQRDFWKRTAETKLQAAPPRSRWRWMLGRPVGLRNSADRPSEALSLRHVEVGTLPQQTPAARCRYLYTE
jgi:hypothetical protein